MDQRLVRLSKTVSHALRHEPWLYELELDDAGWVPVSALLQALQGDRAEWSGVSHDDLAAIIAQSDKQRFEMDGDRIRALYGHSVPQRLQRVPAEPPSTLFHGTSVNAEHSILAEGLKPMGRQYVHLSADQEMARQVAARKRGASVILTIHAADAHRNGMLFYHGNKIVWLADHVPPAFITSE